MMMPPDADIVLAGDIGYEWALADRGVAWLRRAAARGMDILGPRATPAAARGPRRGGRLRSAHDARPGAGRASTPRCTGCRRPAWTADGPVHARTGGNIAGDSTGRGRQDRIAGRGGGRVRGAGELRAGQAREQPARHEPCQATVMCWSSSSTRSRPCTARHGSPGQNQVRGRHNGTPASSAAARSVAVTRGEMASRSGVSQRSMSRRCRRRQATASSRHMGCRPAGPRPRIGHAARAGTDPAVVHRRALRRGLVAPSMR